MKLLRMENTDPDSDQARSPWGGLCRGFPRALPHVKENPAELLTSGSQHTYNCQTSKEKK